MAGPDVRGFGGVGGRLRRRWAAGFVSAVPAGPVQGVEQSGGSVQALARPASSQGFEDSVLFGGSGSGQTDGEQTDGDGSDGERSDGGESGGGGVGGRSVGLPCSSGSVVDQSLPLLVGDCVALWGFVSVKTPRVRMVSIRTRGPDPNGPAGTTRELEPATADLMEQAERIASLMPIPALSYELRSYNRIVEPPPKDLKLLLLDLLAARSNDGDTSAYLGVMLGSTGGGRAGSIPSNVAVWYTSGTEATASTGYARNRGSHEFGHVIGEHHAAYEDILGEKPGASMLTICSALRSAGDDAVPFPYIDVLRNPATRWPAPTAAFLGPMTGLESDDSRIWGFDTRFVDGPHAGLAVVDPADVDSVMSYCSGDPGSQHRWVDAFYHRRFRDAVNRINWDLGPDPSSAGNPAANPLAAFFGYVTSAADGTVAEVKVLPVFTFTPAAPAAAAAAGDYLLELLDGEGEVLRSVSFDAQLALADAGGSGEEPASSELWAVHVVDPPDYASYRIWRGSRQLVQVERSDAAPTVAISSPGAGRSMTGDTVEFTWSGSDADGDDLSYLVQYSTDGGGSYETIAVDYESTALSVKRSSLAGSSRARIRVVASDGARSATAQSAVFTVADNPPEVMVQSPSEGTVYGGLRSIILDAAAYDREDGSLDGSSVSWSSDIDGVIHAGAGAVIDTGDLSEGIHVLTATATDSSALSASASVTVTVRATNDPPAANDDVAHVPRGAAVVDVAANDTDPDTDIDAHSVTVVAPAALGEAPDPGASLLRGGAVPYTGTVAGYDALVYEICDLAGQCATAELTVVVLDDP